MEGGEALAAEEDGEALVDGGITAMGLPLLILQEQVEATAGLVVMEAAEEEVETEAPPILKAMLKEEQEVQEILAVLEEGVEAVEVLTLLANQIEVVMVQQEAMAEVEGAVDGALVATALLALVALD